MRAYETCFNSGMKYFASISIKAFDNHEFASKLCKYFIMGIKWPWGCNNCVPKSKMTGYSAVYLQHRKSKKKPKQSNIFLLGGSGCGSVGRVVASDTKGRRFKSGHQQTFNRAFVYLLTTLLKWRNIMKMRPGIFSRMSFYFFKTKILAKNVKNSIWWGQLKYFCTCDLQKR